MPDPSPETLSAERRGTKNGFLSWLLELVVLVAIAFGLAVAIKTWVVQPFMIPSASMQPTLDVGDRILVNKFIFRVRPPGIGDVVVFLSPDSTQIDYIKRVIAVAGQTVDVRDGVVYVDGKALAEPYVADASRDRYTSRQPTRVPPGQVWLMGDNRANSRDSRYFGPRPVSDLLGTAFVIYWPLDRLRTL